MITLMRVWVGLWKRPACREGVWVGAECTREGTGQRWGGGYRGLYQIAVS